jgi:hypothetical protein
MKYAVHFLLTLLLAATSGCSKDDPEVSLPAATHTGANTAGCRINGQVFVASGYGSGLGKVEGMGGGFNANNKYYLRLNGTLKGQEGSLHVFIDTLNQAVIGNYPLNQSTPILPAASPLLCRSYAAFFPDNNSREVYTTDASHLGEAVITHFINLTNSRASITSGTFEFVAVSNLDPTKTIQVTEGRFDRKQQ